MEDEYSNNSLKKRKNGYYWFRGKIKVWEFEEPIVFESWTPVEVVHNGNIVKFMSGISNEGWADTTGCDGEFVPMEFPEMIVHENKNAYLFWKQRISSLSEHQAKTALLAMLEGAKNVEVAIRVAEKYADRESQTRRSLVLGDKD